MKKNVILLLSVAVALAGCARDSTDGAGTPVEEVAVVLTADETRLLEQLGEPLRLSEARTAELIDEAVALLDIHAVNYAVNYAANHAAGHTRAAAGSLRRSVASIRPLIAAPPAAKSGATRSDGASAEALFSVVDFADSLGYCILAADRRMPDPIICFVPDGSFPHDEAVGQGGREVENPGLRLMLDAIEVYALGHVTRHDTWCDSVSSALLTRTGAVSLDALKGSLAVTTRADGTGSDETGATDNVVYEPLRATWHYNGSRAPMVPMEWGQTAPFNATVVENTEWSNTPVGCVALAAAEIMAYWGHPKSYHGLGGGTIDWNELTSWSGTRWNRTTRYRDWNGPMTGAPADTRKLAADLLWNVAADVNMRFGSTVSLAYTSDAAKLLASLGFSDVAATGFSSDAAMGSLRAARPIIVQGASHKMVSQSVYANAHAWVVDGYIEQRWWNSFRIDKRLYEVERFRTFLHNNFGWNGMDNGYYASGVFDTNAGPGFPSDTRADTASDSDSDTRAEWIGQHYNYQFNILIYPNIYK